MKREKTIEIEYHEKGKKLFQYFTNCRCIPRVIHDREFRYAPEGQGCWI